MPSRVAVLLSKHSSAALALLFRTVLERANRLLSRPVYDVSFVSTLRGRHIAVQGAVLETRTYGERTTIS